MSPQNPIRSFHDGRRFQRDPLSFMKTMKDEENISFFRAGFTTFCLIKSPEHIKRVLVTESQRFGEGKWTQRGKYVMRDCMITREGAMHQERRKVLIPGFDRTSLDKSVNHTIRISLETINQWEDGQSIDLFPYMNRIALEVAGHSLFGTCFKENESEVNHALKILLQAIPRPPIPRLRLIKARKTMERVTSQMTDGPLIKLMREAGLSKTQIQQEVLSLLIASVDTTPKTVAWALSLIGQNRYVEENLHQELNQVLHDHLPVTDDIEKLPYLNQIIQETLRLYPPVHFIDRRAKENVYFGETKIPKGMYLLLSPLLTQRDPKWFENPCEFRTDRWTPDEIKRLKPFSFYPFGSGPHACIGKKLASTEIALIIATLCQKWRFRPLNKSSINANPQKSNFPIILEKIR